MTPPRSSTTRSRRRGRRTAALAAIGAGALLAAAPTAGVGQDAHDVVMAQIVGGTSHADEVAARTGLTLEGTIPTIGWATYLTAPGSVAARTRLLNDPAVSRIDFAGPGDRQSLDFIPRDIIFQQPGTVAIDGFGTADWKWHWTKTNFPAAWDISRGSAAVKVVVIDSEFDTEHPELKNKFATGKNFDSGSAEYHTSNVRATSIDTVFHGTHVAGLVGAASDNNNGVTGACFDCVVIPYKIGFTGAFDQSTDEKFIRDLTEALVAAGDSDGAVISMSLGTSRDHAPLKAAVDYARSKGKVVVASAGNSQLGQQGPAGVPNYPGAYPGVIAVAATRPDDTIAPFSTNGDFVDIAAPGDAVISTWDTRLDNTANTPANLQPTHGIGYKVDAGTSMSAPIVAGLAALMKTVRPDLTADEVEGLMEQSAVDLGAAGKDPVFGYGRIDAFAALKAAQAYVRPTPPPPAPRKAVRFFWSCEIASKDLTAGKQAFIGVPVRAQLVCKGRTAPAIRKVTLELQRFATRGGWRKIGTIKTTNKGRFGFTHRLGTIGQWRVRVAYPGDTVYAPSGALAVRAKAQPRKKG